MLIVALAAYASPPSKTPTGTATEMPVIAASLIPETITMETVCVQTQTTMMTTTVSGIHALALTPIAGTVMTTARTIPTVIS